MKSFRRSENIGIYNNVITNAYVGILSIGYNNSTSPWSLIDQSIDIGSLGGNTISGFGGSTNNTYGIYVTYANGIKIANNTISNATSIGTGPLYATYNNSCGNADIYSNDLSCSSSATSSSGAYAVYTGAGGYGTSTTVNVYSNIIHDWNGLSMTNNALWLIDQIGSPTNLNIYSNSNCSYNNKFSEHKEYLFSDKKNYTGKNFIIFIN